MLLAIHSVSVWLVLSLLAAGAFAMALEVINPNGEPFQLGWPSLAEALAFAFGGSSSGASDVVYKPAGPAVPGLVYTTWGEAIAALLTRQPGSTLWVVGAGGAIDANVATSLQSYRFAAPTPATVLAINDGVTLAGLPGLLENVWLQSKNTNAAVPVVTLAAGATTLLRGNAALWQFGAGGLFVDAAGATGWSFTFDDTAALFTSGVGVGLRVNNAACSGTLNVNNEGSVFGTNVVDGLAGALLVNLSGTGGSGIGFQVPPNFGTGGGTLQMNERTRRVLPCGAGTLAGAPGLASGFLLAQPAAGATAAVDEGVELGDQRRLQRVTVQVLANTMAAVTRVEATLNGLPLVPPVFVDVAAGATGIQLGARVNGLSSNGSSFNNAASVAMQASCNGGGIGNVFTCVGALEYS